MRGRLFWGISLYILLCHLLPVASEDKTGPLFPLPVSITFIPSTYFVGDRVTLRFILDVPMEKQLNPPRSMPTLSWGVVHQIKLIPLGGKKGHEVTIVFTPYRTGRQLFPPIELGPVRIDQIPVQVSSILGKVQEVPQPIREQMSIPYMNLFLVLMVGVVLTIPLIYLPWRGEFHSVLGRILKRYRGKYVYRQLHRILDHLEREISMIDPKTFYTSLQESLRYYLSYRWTPKIIAYTTTEIHMYLDTTQGEGNEENADVYLLEVFQRGDTVRFAGRQVEIDVLRSDLQTVRRAVDRVEQTFWEQRRKAKG